MHVRARGISCCPCFMLALALQLQKDRQEQSTATVSTVGSPSFWLSVDPHSLAHT